MVIIACSGCQLRLMHLIREIDIQYRTADIDTMDSYEKCVKETERSNDRSDQNYYST